MKELSIEEKAKRYDEASKWMEGIYPTLTHGQQMEAETFFPIFKESEDERIKKEIRNFISWAIDRGSITKEQREKAGSWFSWLEKQSEQNSAWSEEDKAVLDALIRRFEGENIYVAPHLAAECLKSLKERVQHQPKQEWSVEDRSKVQRICKYLNEAKKYWADITEVRECIEWLKGLIPHNT